MQLPCAVLALPLHIACGDVHTLAPTHDGIKASSAVCGSARWYERVVCLQPLAITLIRVHGDVCHQDKHHAIKLQIATCGSLRLCFGVCSTDSRKKDVTAKVLVGRTPFRRYHVAALQHAGREGMASGHRWRASKVMLVTVAGEQAVRTLPPLHASSQHLERCRTVQLSLALLAYALVGSI